MLKKVKGYISYISYISVTHPSLFRSTTATSYPKEDASPGPSRMYSGESMVEASPSFLSRTTAPLWLVLGAPDTTVSCPFLVILCPESREKPAGEKVRLFRPIPLKKENQETCLCPTTKILFRIHLYIANTPADRIWHRRWRVWWKQQDKLLTFLMLLQHSSMCKLGEDQTPEIAVQHKLWNNAVHSCPPQSCCDALMITMNQSSAIHHRDLVMEPWRAYDKRLNAKRHHKPK